MDIEKHLQGLREKGREQALVEVKAQNTERSETARLIGEHAQHAKAKPEYVPRSMLDRMSTPEAKASMLRISDEAKAEEIARLIADRNEESRG